MLFAHPSFCADHYTPCKDPILPIFSYSSTLQGQSEYSLTTQPFSNALTQQVSLFLYINCYITFNTFIPSNISIYPLPFFKPLLIFSLDDRALLPYPPRNSDPEDVLPIFSTLSSTGVSFFIY